MISCNCSRQLHGFVFLQLNDFDQIEKFITRNTISNVTYSQPFARSVFSQFHRNFLMEKNERKIPSKMLPVDRPIDRKLRFFVFEVV